MELPRARIRYRSQSYSNFFKQQFMSDKKPIKVVKRVERTAARRAKPKDKSAQKAAHEIVDTVSSWVNDFQRKRHQETAQAITSLLQSRRQPAES